MGAKWWGRAKVPSSSRLSSHYVVEEMERERTRHIVGCVLVGSDFGDIDQVQLRILWNEIDMGTCWVPLGVILGDIIYV